MINSDQFEIPVVYKLFTNYFFSLGTSKGGPLKLLSLEEALTVLLTGFLRGGNSFLKGTGEMIKGSSSVSREVRVGITQVRIIQDSVSVMHRVCLWN